MKPRLIIHIGTYKTGTTYLQKTFRDNYEKLLDQKILYPKNLGLDLLDYGPEGLRRRVLNTSHNNQGLNLFLLCGQNGSRKLRNFFVKQCSAYDCSAILLSWEGLYLSKFNYPKLFQKCKDEFEINTICFFRRPDYFMESYWAEATKLNNHLQIAPFLNTKRHYRLLEITNNLIRWQKLGSVIAANYEEGKRLGILEYFNRKAEIPATVTSEMKIKNIKINPSISANCASTLAQLRKMGLSPNVGAVISAFRHDRGSLALGSHLRAKLLAGRKDDLTAARRKYGLEFSDEMPEERTDPLACPSPTSLLQALVTFVLKGAPAGRGRSEVRSNAELCWTFQESPD